MLYKQNYEYIDGYTDKSGFNIVMHDYGAMTFPLESGFSVPTGFETNIGFKMVGGVANGRGEWAWFRR